MLTLKKFVFNALVKPWNKPDNEDNSFVLKEIKIKASNEHQARRSIITALLEDGSQVKRLELVREKDA